VLVKLDSGFAAYPNVDPLIIADINGSGTLTSLDASRVLQEVSYLTGASSVDRLEIPPIPAGIGPLSFSGPDPRVDIPVDAIADPGELVTVPIRIDTTAGLESVQLRIGYDASRFEVVGVRRGSVSGDFGWFITGQEPGRITVDMSRLEALQEGSGTLARHRPAHQGRRAARRQPDRSAVRQAERRASDAERRAAAWCRRDRRADHDPQYRPATRRRRRCRCLPPAIGRRRRLRAAAPPSPR
jgi:hypothetical protein